MKKLFVLIALLISMGSWAAAPKITASLSLMELQKLKASAPSVSAYFGYSVAVDGNTAIIGEYGYNSSRGRAYIYDYNTTTHGYTQVAILNAADADAGDSFGRSVAISGDTVVVGAYKDDETNSDSGAAYIYEKPQSGWTTTAQEDAKLKASDADVGDWFGYSVAISGNTLVVGAYYDDETNSNSGAAYIYEKPQSGWANSAQEKAKLKASDANVGDYFGTSVAISGNTLVVGAWSDDEINNDSGAAYIYEKPQSGWVDTTQQKAKLKASDADAGDYFGTSVAISGDTLVVGANGDRQTNSYSGAAYIYEKPQSGWTTTAQEDAKLKASDADYRDYFGTSVAISGDTVVVGASGDDETNSDSGAAYIYEKPQSGWANSAQEKAKLKASDANASDYFGASVAISGDSVVIGVYGNDETNSNSGAAYIFTNALVQNSIENKKDILAIEASDSDGDTFTFSLDTGADESFFDIDANSGLLSFKTARDFENPQDADGNNIYEVGVTLRDTYDETSFYRAFIKTSDVEYEGESLQAKHLKILNKIKSSAPSGSAGFGVSVAVNGDTAIIGEYLYNSGTGRAYIYDYNTTTHVYNQVAMLSASDAATNAYFGLSVAISGDTVVVGAYSDDETNSNSGAAYIYEKPQSGWANTAQEEAKLKASDADAGDSFGRSVAISGDTVVVGAYKDDETNSDSGAAYIYEKPQSGWTTTAQEDAKLKASDADVGDWFGYSVAISGNTLVVGAYSDDETNSDSGAAYIYEKPQSGWVDTAQEDAKLKASDADSGDYFGRSVAISGDSVVVGANKDDETNSDSGAAYIYEKPQSGWTDTAQEKAKLKASDADADDHFGLSVAISSDTVVVGADLNGDDLSDYSGAAYIYEKPQSGWVSTSQEEAKLETSDTKDDFGISVAISGDTVVVGAYRDDETNADSGAAYIYKAKETVINSAIIMYLLN